MELDWLEALLDCCTLKHVRIDAFHAAKPDATWLATVDGTMVGAAEVATLATAILVLLGRGRPRQTSLAAAANADASESWWHSRWPAAAASWPLGASARNIASSRRTAAVRWAGLLFLVVIIFVVADGSSLVLLLLTVVFVVFVAHRLILIISVGLLHLIADQPLNELCLAATVIEVQISAVLA